MIFSSITRRILCAMLGAGTCIISAPSKAADFPDKPITIVSPFSPGGAADVLARLLANKLEAHLINPAIKQSSTL